LLTAGHETTATGLLWAFERLLRTPRVLARLVQSLDDDEYLEAVVKATLRVRPVVVDVARRLTRDTPVAGYVLPAGMIVLPAIAAVHARHDLYPSPREFRPERFLDGRAESYLGDPAPSVAHEARFTVGREVLARDHAPPVDRAREQLH
jgi:cytochrome P450